MTFPDVIASHNYQEHHIKHALTPTEESRDPGMVSMIALGMEGEADDQVGRGFSTESNRKNSHFTEDKRAAQK